MPAERPLQHSICENDGRGPLEAAAGRNGRSVQELEREAIESWLADAVADDAEHLAIERARAEAAEQGGVEFERFFDGLLEGGN